MVFPISNSRETPSRTEPASRVERAHPAGLLGRFVVFRGGPSGSGCTIKRSSAASSGRWPGPDGRAGRSPSPWPGADDHAGSESLVDIAVVPEGEGTGLSA